MRRTTRRAPGGCRFEALEPRSLLSFDPATSLLVGLAPGTSVAAAQADLAAFGGRIAESFPSGPSVVTLAPGVNRTAVINALRSDPHFRYAEADGSLHVTDTIPNDPRFSAQWGLSSPTDVDIDAPQAWDITTGNPATIVAVLDSGVDLGSVEFAGRLWTNPADGSHGWNFISNTTDIQDNDGHGTHVAGILAASANNAIGVAGVNWHAQIMPLKIIDGSGNGSVDAAVAAVYYAVQHGARVINASWDGPDYSQALADAISYAGSQGVVFVAAAGNESANNDLIPSYPANYRFSNVISVAAVDATGTLADFSNWGASTVDLAAPGVSILSTVPGGYAVYSGTSMAAPFVSGVVSLVLGQNPGLTAAQAVHQVLSTTKPLPGLFGRTVTGGMVDAYRAVAGGNHITANFTQGIDKGLLSLNRPSTSQWSLNNPVTGNVQFALFGQSGSDVAVPADYDGTGRLDYAVFRPSTAQWLIQGPTGGRVVQFGGLGDIPVPADYDGDGKADIAVFRPSTATWFVLGSVSGPFAFQFGGLGDLPVPADYDADGRADLAVFRPSTDQWFILRSALGPMMQQFGPAGRALPVPADYDGDGRTDLAVFDPALSYWYILGSSAGYIGRQFGPAGQSIPAPADYDHDGVADIAVYQPTNGVWYVMRSSAGPLAQQFGLPGLDVPLASPIEYRLGASGTRVASTSSRTAITAASVGAGSSGRLTAAAIGETPDLVPLVQGDGSNAAALLPLAQTGRSPHGRHAGPLHDLALERLTDESSLLRDRDA